MDICLCPLRAVMTSQTFPHSAKDKTFGSEDGELKAYLNKHDESKTDRAKNSVKLRSDPTPFIDNFTVLVWENAAWK